MTSLCGKRKNLLWFAAVIVGIVFTIGATSLGAKAATKDVTTKKEDGTTETHTYTSISSWTDLPAPAADTSSYVYLANDFSFGNTGESSYTLAAGQSLYLDLSGHTLTIIKNLRAFSLKNTGAKLVLADSVGGGAIDGGTTLGNQWAGYARFIDLEGASSKAILDGVTLRNGSTGNHGGAIMLRGKNTKLCMFDSTIDSCWVNKYSSTDNSGNTVWTNGIGGAIFAQENSTIEMHDSVIQNCYSALNCGGAIGLAGTAELKMYGTSKITGCESKTANSGAVWISDTAKLYMYDDAAIENCKAATNGGSISNGSSTFEIHMFGRSKITGGYAPKFGGNIVLNGASLYMHDEAEINGGKSDDTTDGYGGNIRIMAGTLYMYDQSVISGGETQRYGGNISLTTGRIVMEGGTIRDGYAKHNGGNITVAGKGSVIMSGSAKITGGRCDAYRGGNITFNNANGSLTMNDNAEISGGTAVAGGNVHLGASGCTLTMNGGTIANGTASSKGSNLYMTSTSVLTIENGRITNGTLTAPESGFELSDVALDANVNALVKNGYFTSIVAKNSYTLYTGFFMEKPENASLSEEYWSGTGPVIARGEFRNPDTSDTNLYVYTVTGSENATHVRVDHSVETIDDLYMNGTSITVHPAEKSGFTFAGWTDSYDDVNGVGTVYSTTPEYTFTAAGSDIYRIAFYNRNADSIEITTKATLKPSFPFAEITTSGGGYFTNGDTVTLSSSDAKGYVKFKGWYLDGVLRSEEQTLTFTVSDQTEGGEYEAVYEVPFAYGVSDSFADVGDNNCVQIKTNVTAEDYAGFLASLPLLGFTKIYDNGTGLDNGNVVLSSFRDESDRYLVHVSYMAKSKVLYVEFSDVTALSEHLFDEEEWKADASRYANTVLVMPSLVASMQQQTAAGNSFIIRLKNGHFIVNDGGNNIETAEFIRYLEEMAQGEIPVIEGWFLTHPHGDHYGVMRTIVNNASYRNRIRVNGIYFSSPSYDDYLYMDNNSTTNYTVIHTLMSSIPKFRDENGDPTVYYRTYTGQRLYFSDVAVDISLSQDQLPTGSDGVTNYYGSARLKRAADLNDASLFTMIHIEGQKVLIGGDGDYGCAKFMDFTYSSDYLSVDVMNMLHHGYNLRNHFKMTNYNSEGSNNSFSKTELLFNIKTALYTGTDNIDATYAGITTSDDSGNPLSLEALKEQRLSNVWHTAYRGRLQIFLEAFEKNIQEHFSYSEGTRVLVFPYEVGESMVYEDWAKPAIVARNLLLSDDLGVKLYAKVNAGTAKLLIRIGDGEEEEIARPSSTDSAGRYVFSFRGVTPEKLGDLIVAKLVDENNAVLDEKSFTVKEYLLAIAGKTAAQNGFTGSNAEAKQNALVTLVNDLLKYGAETQIYRNYRTDALVYDGTGSDRTPECDVTIGTEYKGETVSFLSANILHRTANVIRVRIRIPEGATVTVKMNGKTCELEPVENTDTYYIYSEGLRATDYARVYTFEAFVDGSTAPDAKLTYCLNTYAKAMYEKENTTNNMQAFAKALYNYGFSASAFAAL